MMAKSLKDIKPRTEWFDVPTPKDLLKNAQVDVLVFLHQNYGMPTPISGDPVALP